MVRIASKTSITESPSPPRGGRPSPVSRAGDASIASRPEGPSWNLSQHGGRRGAAVLRRDVNIDEAQRALAHVLDRLLESRRQLRPVLDRSDADRALATGQRRQVDGRIA